MTIDEKLALAEKRRMIYGLNPEALLIQNLADVGSRALDVEQPKQCGTCAHLDNEKVPSECKVKRKRGEYCRMAYFRSACGEYRKRKEERL